MGAGKRKSLWLVWKSFPTRPIFNKGKERRLLISSTHLSNGSSSFLLIELSSQREGCRRTHRWRSKMRVLLIPIIADAGEHDQAFAASSTENNHSTATVVPLITDSFLWFTFFSLLSPPLPFLFLDWLCSQFPFLFTVACSSLLPTSSFAAIVHNTTSSLKRVLDMHVDRRLACFPFSLSFSLSPSR